MQDLELIFQHEYDTLISDTMSDGSLEDLTEMYLELYFQYEDRPEFKSKEYYSQLQFVTRKIEDLCKKTTRKKLSKVI